MKKLLVVLLIIINSVSVYSKRISANLDGEWKFQTDSTCVYNPAIRMADKSIVVNVPHTWGVMKGFEEYIGKAWYERDFFVSNDYKGRNVILKFNGVYRDASVYINGKFVGDYLSSGYTAFYMDISRFVKYGEDNRLTVSATNEYSKTAFPYSSAFDWANDGGIIRSVELMVIEKPSIFNAHVSTNLDGQGTVSVKLWQKSNTPFVCKYEILERGSRKKVMEGSVPLKKGVQSFNFSFLINSPKLWHFDHPNLYDIRLITVVGGYEKDLYQTHFGFREIKVEGEKLYLNGEPVRLLGVEWLPGSNPKYGMAEPKEYIDSMLTELKEVNCTITRFHMQQDEYTLSRMDEIGILVQEEMPWWQQPGNLNDTLFDVAKKQLSTMIDEHYNHPCVFSWGISNEVYHCTQREQYTRLVQFVNERDSSRLIQIVANEMPARKLLDESLLGSVPTWNEYVGTWHGKSREDLPEFFRIVKDVIGERPLFITEHGLCEPRFTGGDARRIEEMHYHIAQWQKQEYLAAAIYFSLNDYRTHVGEDGVGAYRCRVHGVSGMCGERKPSFYVLKSYASPLQVLDVRSRDGKIYVALRCRDSLPSYTVNGYVLEADGMTMPLPTLKPGEETSVCLPASASSFVIRRPGGYNVLNHHF